MKFLIVAPNGVYNTSLGKPVINSGIGFPNKYLQHSSEKLLQLLENKSYFSIENLFEIDFKNTCSSY